MIFYNLPRKRLVFELGMPLLLVLFLTLVFRFSNLDLHIASFFYHKGEGWRFADFWLWQMLYAWGMVPGILMAVVALGGLLGSFVRKSKRQSWRMYLLILLLLAIGPGLLVNTIFKDNWGRTRPKHVVELGGKNPFLKVWEPGEPGTGKSFPSGHASIGFYLMAPYFVLRRRRPRLAGGFLLGGSLYGALMGVGRMAQGAHFASDVLWSWGFVYLSGLLLCYWLRPEGNRGNS